MINHLTKESNSLPLVSSISDERASFTSDLWLPRYQTYAKDRNSDSRFFILVSDFDIEKIMGGLHQRYKLEQYNETNLQSPYKVGVFVTDLTPILCNALNEAQKSIKIVMFRFYSKDIVEHIKTIWLNNKTLDIQILLDYNSNISELNLWIEFMIVAAKKCIKNKKYKYPDIRLTLDTSVYHSELIIIDENKITAFGSANMTKFGLGYNKELLKEPRNKELNDCWLRLFNKEFKRFDHTLCSFWYNYLERECCLNNTNNWIKFTSVASYVLDRDPNIGYYALIFLKIAGSLDYGLINLEMESKNQALEIFTKVSWNIEESQKLVFLYNKHYTQKNTIVDTSALELAISNNKFRTILLGDNTTIDDIDAINNARSKGIIPLRYDDLLDTFQILENAKSHIILFSTCLGKEFADKLVDMLENKKENEKVDVIVVVWKNPFPNTSNWDKLIDLGVTILQLQNGVQHHKCIIVDGIIITNGGSANLSYAAFSGSHNQGETCIQIPNQHSDFELLSMIVVVLLGFEEVASNLSLS